MRIATGLALVILIGSLGACAKKQPSPGRIVGDSGTLGNQAAPSDAGTTMTAHGTRVTHRSAGPMAAPIRPQKGQLGLTPPPGPPK